MNDISKAVYVQSQATCALIEALSIIVDNQTIYYCDEKHTGDEVRALIDKYGIGHNSVIGYLDNE